MPLNPESVGSVGEPSEFSWSSKDSLLYAVSLNCGADHLAFTTENTNGVVQRALPTQAVVMGSSDREKSAMRNIGSFNPAMLVHGQQAITWHQEIPASGKAISVDKIAAMYDKGKAGVVVMEDSATLPDGTPLYTKRSSVFIRGEGGWGGERGPSGAINEPPDRAADHEVVFQTSRDQAFLYRLNGDRNPLHTDPSFAAMGGFATPILHGLCSYGFTGRALLSELAGNDPAKMNHMEARFSSPVLPGDALTIRIWRMADGEAVFTTTTNGGVTGDGAVCIDQGLCRFS